MHNFMVKSPFLNPNYGFPTEFQEQADKFFNSYRLQREVACPEEKLKTLKNKQNRTCIFCKMQYPLVSFHKDAHILSNLLGNRYLISDFECDNCNHIFGRFESDLANYLGITRTIQSAKGKEKVPKFKSADGTLIMEAFSDEDGKKVSIERFDGLDKTFEFDKENHQTIVTYTLSPYTPIFVYKALLKMALSIIPTEDLKYYDFAFKYLISNKYDSIYKGFATVSAYSTPINHTLEKPVGLLFKKINSKEKRFTHIFSLYTLNVIYQIAIPFNSNDGWFFKNGENIETVWCPPLFGEEYPFPIETIITSSLDLNSTEKVKGKQGKFILPGRSEDFEMVKFVDKNTGSLYEEVFDGSKVVKIEVLKVESGNENQT